jgi:hypothetical protein
MDRIEFDDREPQIVDVTRTEAVAEKLVESRIDCLKEEKVGRYKYCICSLFH